MMKRVLVTGGAGFVGSHLVDRLLARGDHVIALDNLFTGTKRNVAQHHNNANFTFLEQDVINPIDLQVDEIYNLACPASPVHYQADPIFTFKTSIWGALNLLELAERNGAKILQASTSEVYGDPDIHPQPESYWGNVNTIGPRSCYDEGKRGAETLFSDFRKSRGVDARIVRIFNTYGPRMHPQDGRVVSNFIVQALKGENLTVFGTGNQTRSFCFVDDLVSGILSVMDYSGGLPGPINLGNDGEFTMIELAELVLNITKSKAKLVNMPLPQDDPKQRRPDLSRARSLFGYQPKVALRDGLIATTHYFQGL